VLRKPPAGRFSLLPVLWHYADSVDDLWRLIMSEIGTGVLPRQLLRELMATGYVSGVADSFLNPASIDMPLSEEAYRLESIFLPRSGEHVRTMLNEVGSWKHDLNNPLEVGVPYLIRLDGEWKLPSGVYGYANPKSSTGRLNLFCRIVADNVDMYDSLPKGWEGEMWVLVRADSFPVKLSAGLAVSQLRLFDGKFFLDSLRMEIAVKKHGLIFTQNGSAFPPDELRAWQDSLIVTLAVGKKFGWECRGTHKPLDFGKIGEYNATDFFEPVTPSNGSFKLRKGGFYILSTKERIMVPPYLSAELRAIDPRLGEFRSHAAGYIDPGWGWGKNGESKGRPITLEVIPHEDMLVRDGQAIARIRYEHMKEIPDVSYEQAQSNYTNQEGPRLSKHFKE
jgi:dCTP deaminase